MFTQSNNRGFTLIELLVVISLTIIIMGLVFGPVIESFNFTRQAQTMIQIQDNARMALTLVSKDLAEAVYVCDNTRDYISMPAIYQNGTPTGVTGNVAQNAPQVQFAKIDMVMPREFGYCTDKNHPAGVSREFRIDQLSNGQSLREQAPTCPYDGSLLELRPVQPLAPDTKITRYFIALNHPDLPYGNRYLTKSSVAPNFYVLYRAEFNWSDKTLFANTNTDKTARVTINDYLDAPDFFYDSRSNGVTNPDGSPQTYAQAWRKIAVPVVTLGYTDLINLTFDGSGTPLVTPTVRFSPTAVFGDPMVPMTGATDDPEHGSVPPTAYKATYGNWVLPYQVTYTNSAGTQYATAEYQDTSGALGMGIFPLTAIPSNYPTNLPSSSACVFDIDDYTSEQGLSPYHYAAINVPPASPNGNPPPAAFTVDTVKGMVNFSFPVVDTGQTSLVSNNSSFNFPMAVTAVFSTDQVNSSYITAQSGSYTDVYRKAMVNPPVGGKSPLPGYSGPICPLLNGTVVPSSVRVYAPNAESNQSNQQTNLSYLLYSRLPYFVMDPGKNQFTVDLNYPVLNNGSVDTSMAGTAALYFHSTSLTQAAAWSADMLPTGGNIYVYYEVQNNKLGDKLKANYTTKSLITVIMGVRAYNPSTGKPLNIQLTNKIHVRNVAG
jgi:prepilin-type N-terminal cleavage/methylation domain-containing protein